MNYQTPLHNRRVKIAFDKDLGLTKQSFRDSCDVNTILKRFQQTGVIDHVSKHSPQYGFANSESFHEATLLVQSAQEMFADLPSAARAFFDNDPAQFLDYVDGEPSEEKNNKLVELGLTSRQNYPQVAAPQATETTKADEEPPSSEDAGL